MLEAIIVVNKSHYWNGNWVDNPLQTPLDKIDFFFLSTSDDVPELLE